VYHGVYGVNTRFFWLFCITIQYVNEKRVNVEGGYIGMG
jgi:hypothetical protein